MKFINFFKKKPHLIILLFILSIGLFFRTYQIVDRFDFGHDADLYSWIVKDIVVNHHPRLIGQLTSAPGIFIGPIFYYSLVPFFIITGMDPVGAIIPIIILGFLTSLSYYYVFCKLFNKNIGLIMSFLNAASLWLINLDRQVIPTTATNIWSIWYFYSVINIASGNFSVLPLLAILIGLIWNIHIALAPILIVIPIAFIFSKRLPNLKQTSFFLLILIITSLPLIIFEGKHNFIQTKSMISNFTTNFGTSNSISELRMFSFNAKNENGKLNLEQDTKFMLDLNPEAPKIDDVINIKVAVKNQKYDAKTTVKLDCGSPDNYSIPYYIAEFKWDTKNCSGIEHNITISASSKDLSFFQRNKDKFLLVLEKEKTNVYQLFITPTDIPISYQYLFTYFILSTPFICWFLKLINTRLLVLMLSWIFSVTTFFTFSSIPVSEYYLASINVILLLSVSLIICKVFNKNKIGKYFVLLLFIVFLSRNLLYFISQSTYNKGYLEKKAAVNYIKNDALKNGFPCVGISYITSIGEGVGFRYFFFINNLKIAHSSEGVPVYNIFIPDEFSKGHLNKKFGHIGISLPTDVPSKEVMEKSCQTPDTNLTDSFFGYVQ